MASLRVWEVVGDGVGEPGGPPPTYVYNLHFCHVFPDFLGLGLKGVVGISNG